MKGNAGLIVWDQLKRSVAFFFWLNARSSNALITFYFLFIL